MMIVRSCFFDVKEIMVLIDTYNLALSVDIRAGCHNFVTKFQGNKSRFAVLFYLEQGD